MQAKNFEESNLFLTVTLENSGFLNKEPEMAPDIKKTATNYFLRREVLIDLINPRKQTAIHLNIAL